MNKYQEALSEVIRMSAQSDEPFPTEEVEALQELVDRATPKKAKLSNEQKIRYVQTYVCPTCGKEFTGGKLSNYCYRCGQALDWGEE